MAYTATNDWDSLAEALEGGMTQIQEPVVMGIVAFLFLVLIIVVFLRRML